MATMLGMQRDQVRAVAALLGMTAAITLGACSSSRAALASAPPAVLGDSSAVTAWEHIVRPDSLAVVAASLVAFVESEDGSGCPRRERDGAMTTARGGCTDGHGRAWTGTARAVLRGRRLSVRMREFGRDGLVVDGVVTIEDDAFDLDVLMRDDRRSSASEPAWLAVDAAGAHDRDWSAHGLAGAEGMGRVELRAVAVALDAARCAHEPLRGALELRSDGQQPVDIHYDGDADCDVEGTARWSIADVDQGELDGVRGVGCQGRSGDSGPLALAALPLMVAGVGRKRRRAGSV